MGQLDEVLKDSYKDSELYNETLEHVVNSLLDYKRANIEAWQASTWYEEATNDVKDFADEWDALIKKSKEWREEQEKLGGLVFWEKAALDLEKQVQTAIDAVDTSALKGKIKDAFKTALNITVDVLSKAWSGFKAILAFPEQFVNALQGWVDFAEGLPEMLEETIPALIEKVPEMIDAIIRYVPDIINAIINYLPRLIRQISSRLPELATTFVGEVIPNFINQIPDIISAFIDYLPDIIVAFAENIPKVIDALVEAVPRVVHKLADAMPGIATALAESIPTVAGSLAEAIPEVAVALAKEMPNVAVKLAEAVWNAVTELMPFGIGGGEGLISDDIPILGLLHKGGKVSEAPGIFAPAYAFAGAPRAHTGLAPDERRIIARDDEWVLTDAQMRGIASGPKTINMNVNIDGKALRTWIYTESKEGRLQMHERGLVRR